MSAFARGLPIPLRFALRELRGGIHGFRNESGEPASMRLHFAPGAEREGYFEGLAEWARNGRPSEAEVADFYLRHDNHWLPETGV